MRDRFVASCRQFLSEVLGECCRGWVSPEPPELRSSRSIPTLPQRSTSTRTCGAVVSLHLDSVLQVGHLEEFKNTPHSCPNPTSNLKASCIMGNVVLGRRSPHRFRKRFSAPILPTRLTLGFTRYNATEFASEATEADLPQSRGHHWARFCLIFVRELTWYRVRILPVYREIEIVIPHPSAVPVGSVSPATSKAAICVFLQHFSVSTRKSCE